MGSFSKKLSSGGHRNCSAEGRERLSSARTRGQVVPARHFSPEDWGRCGSRRKENSLGYWVATQGSPPMPTKEDMVMFQVRKPASGLAFIFPRKPSRHWPYHLPCTAPRPPAPTQHTPTTSSTFIFVKCRLHNSPASTIWWQYFPRGEADLTLEST